MNTFKTECKVSTVNTYEYLKGLDMEEKKPTSIRFPKSLSVWLKSQAKKNERSVSSEVILLVRRIKEKAEKQEKPAHEQA